MKTDKFNYNLPEHLIAQYPPKNRTDSKLLVAIESIHHEVFKNIGSHFCSGDLLVINQTSVIPARLFGKKITGGKIEILLERFLSNRQTLAQVRSAGNLKDGMQLIFSFAEEKFVATVQGRKENFFILDWSADPQILFKNHGQIPLLQHVNLHIQFRCLAPLTQQGEFHQNAYLQLGQQQILFFSD